MSSNRKVSTLAKSDALFEKLEERLLLTTIHEGEFFIYHDSQGDTVRLTVTDPSVRNAAVEVMVNTFANNVNLLTDLPGIFSGDLVGLQNHSEAYVNSVGALRHDYYGGGVDPTLPWEHRWADLPNNPLTATLILRPVPNTGPNFDAMSFTVLQEPAGNSYDQMWLEDGDYIAIVPIPTVVTGPDTTGPLQTLIGNATATTVGPGILQKAEWMQVARGSRSDIYSVVVLTGGMETALTATVVNYGILPANRPFILNNALWADNVTAWDTPNLPSVRPPAVMVQTPAGSGGVLIGGYRGSGSPASYLPSIVASWTPGSQYAGGNIFPGITVASDVYRMPSGTQLGSDVRAVAADSLGTVFAADGRSFHATVINSTITGDIGGVATAPVTRTNVQFGEINALAASNVAARNTPFYTVDSISKPVTYVDHDVNGNPVAMLGSTQAIAYDAGFFYAVDEVTGHLIRTTLNGRNNGPATNPDWDRGELIDASSDNWQFQNVQGLDFRITATGDEMWGVGYVRNKTGQKPEAPAGQCLFFTKKGPVYMPQPVTDVTWVANFPPTDDQGATWEGDHPLASIAWSPDGTVLYGVTITNQLVVITWDVATSVGHYSPVGGVGRFVAGPDFVNGVLGIDFIGDTLYGITKRGQVFYLANQANPDNITDATTAVIVGDTGVTAVACLTAQNDPNAGRNDQQRLFTVALDRNGILRLTAIPLNATVVTVLPRSPVAPPPPPPALPATIPVPDPLAGTSTQGAALVDSAVPTYGFTDVTALDYRGNVLYGVATVVDVDPNDPTHNPATIAGRWLVSIDPASGVTTRLHKLAGPGDLASIAWDSTDGWFYGVEMKAAPSTHELWTLKPVNAANDLAGWTETDVVTLATGGMTGLEWVNFGGAGPVTSALFAVDDTTLYTIDTTTGVCRVLDDTGMTGLTGLTFYNDPLVPADQPMLWATANVGKDIQGGDDVRLVQIPLSARLMSFNPAAPAATALVPRVALYDSQNPMYGYDDIEAMDFTFLPNPDPTGAPIETLVAVARVISLAPDNSEPAVSGNSWLVTIDIATGEVTRLGQLNVDTLSTIAFDDAGVLYGFNPATSTLVTVDVATQTVSNALSPTVAITGMDFVGSTLFGVTADQLYTINLTTGVATPVPRGNLPPVLAGNLGATDLTSDPDGNLYASSQGGVGGQYFLLSIYSDAAAAVQDMGRIVVAGTVAGIIQNVGNFDMIEVGFLWGAVTSNANINSVLMRQGGGMIGRTTQNAESVITADGVVNFVDSRNGAALYTGVVSKYLATVPLPPWPTMAWGLGQAPGQTTLQELEYIFPATPNPIPVFDAAWIAGNLVDYTNDSQQTAQVLNLDSLDPTTGNGTIEIDGTIGPCDTTSPPNRAVPDTQDWYAVPMLAGQTITVDGMATLMGMWTELLDHPFTKVRLYDSLGHWMDALGFTSVEDVGIGSGGMTTRTQAVMTFTAPAADTYYIEVLNSGSPDLEAYWLSIGGTTRKAIGGVNVVGDFAAANAYSVLAMNGGNFGTFVATGSAVGTAVQTSGGGDIYAVHAGVLGSLLAPDYVGSEGNVGRITSTTGQMIGAWLAGAPPTDPQKLQNNNAYIQIISAKTDIVYIDPFTTFITATGSIGVIEVGGNMEGLPITINDDKAGPAGHLDLIEVTGDWGTLTGVPLLTRGPKGDFGFVHVLGTVYVKDGPWITPLTETTLTRGETATLNDDGGGQATITATLTPVLDASGKQVMDPQTGKPLMFMPTISYGYIGVDDSASHGLGNGGVIVNLRTNGWASITSRGNVQISDLDFSYDPAVSTTHGMDITGTGAVDIYNLASDGVIDAITNNTAGRLVGGNIPGIGSLVLAHGGLGWYASVNTKEWVHALMNAPVTPNPVVQPQYGWFDGKINGLNVEGANGALGNVGILSVGGDLGDVRVTGTLGTVTVNADHTRGIHDWDGVKGLVWAGKRIESIDVGNGLKQEGATIIARAAIMSGGSIGTVSIAGPRKVINGVVYGELDGSILALNDTTFIVTNPNGTTTTYLQDGIGQVIGTDGAQCTAIIAAEHSLELFEDMAPTILAPIRPAYPPYPPPGTVGYVRFSGQGALIYGAEVVGDSVREVSDALETLGIVDTFISGLAAPVDGLSIGRVAAGGPGMLHVIMSGNGADMGVIEGLGPVADIIGCYINSTDGVRTIRARDLKAETVAVAADDIRILFGMRISAPGTIGTVTLTGNLEYMSAYDNTGRPIVSEGRPYLLTGSVGTMTVAGDVVVDSFAVAGKFAKLIIGGKYNDALLYLRGADANLMVMDVVGDIGSETSSLTPPVQSVVQSSGQIGSLTSRTGAIYANVATTLENGAINSDMKSISVAKGFYGDLKIDGSLGSFTCYSDMGVNPALYTDETALQVFSIGGSLGLLKVAGTPGNPSDLFADFNVSGNIGTIDVDGNFYAQVFALGDVGKVSIKGLFGGDPAAEVIDQASVLTRGNRGSLEALGDIGTTALAKQGDLTADITAGGSIQSITVMNGSIVGNILSRHGDILGVTVTNGSLLGNVSGWNVRSVVVTNGNVTGDILATNGSIQTMKVTGVRGDPSVGNVQGNVIANNGRIESLAVATGNLGVAGEKLTVSATGGIKSISVTGGNLYSNVETGGVLDALSVGGTASDLTIAADGGIKSLTTTGSVNNIIVRGGTTLDKVAIGEAAVNSTFSAGWKIGTFATKTNLTGSNLLAGYDVGQDLGSILLGSGAGTLAPSQSVGVGSIPVGAVLVDMNDDGALDLVVADRGANAVSILLGNGNGTFGMRRMYNAGSLPSAVAVGDVNFDGIPDIVVTNEGDDTVSFLLGNGDGSFRDQTTLAVGDAPVALLLADLNGDDIVDLVTANRQGGGVSVSLNDGSGVFAAPTTIVTGGTPTALALGDFDSANGPDIAVADGTNNSVTLLMNDRAGGFSAGATVDVGTHPVSLAVADFNSDGVADLATANQGSDDISILLGDGAGGLTAQAPIALGAGAEPVAISAAQMNGLDTFPDLVVLNQGTQRVLVLQGSVDGTFTPRPSVSVSEDSTALAVGDANTDGAQDVIVVARGGGQNPFNSGVAHSGTIASVTVGGTMDGSVVSAGMAPADDGSFSNPALDTPAPGYGGIAKMTVKAFGDAWGVNTVVADSSIDPKFLAAAAIAGGAKVQVPASYAPAIVHADGDFGPASTGKVPSRTSANGITFNLTGAGLANYDGAGTLTLRGTTASSNLTITYKVVGGVAPVINIVGGGLDDESLGALKTVGNVSLGNISLDGPIKTITATAATKPISLWNLPGGVGTVSLINATGLNVIAGAIGTWTMKGTMDTGSVSADSLGSFTTAGDSGANITTTLGALTALSVKGTYTGQIQTFLNVGSVTTTGAFNGSAVAERGDLTTLKVGTDMLGRIQASRGAIGTVTITAGNFGSTADLPDPTQESSIRASNGIGTITVTKGAFYGLVSTDGSIKTVNVPKGVMSGRLRASGSIGVATFGSMMDGFASAGGDFTTVTINGNMLGSSVYSGFDPGDAGYSTVPEVRDANVQIDALTPNGFRTAANVDRGLGGDIGTFLVKGNMGGQVVGGVFVSEPCTISAAVDPGADGFVGTSDDLAHGTGYILKATVMGSVYGDSIEGTTYGFIAASKTPTVMVAWGKGGKGENFGGTENVVVTSLPAAVGPLEVTDVHVDTRSITVTFNHGVNASTINEATFKLMVFSDDLGNNPVDISTTQPNTITYDAVAHTVTLTLNAPATWNNLNMGNYYTLTIDGQRVTDGRSSPLDGEYGGIFPSGDLRPGGDFVYSYVYGQVVLSNVPAYINYFGSAPTAVAMLAGYYDQMSAFQTLISGDATNQTAQVNGTIASLGNGNGTVLNPGTPGSGHVADYAYYGGVNDAGWAVGNRDLSDPALVLSTGVSPHANNCIADFLKTSFSYVRAGNASNAFGQTQVLDIAPGVDAFFNWDGGFNSTSTLFNGPAFTWGIYTAEIDAGRPVLLGLSDPTGTTYTHEVIGIGYDVSDPHRYAYYDTIDRNIHWANFALTSDGIAGGITHGVTVTLT